MPPRYSDKIPPVPAFVHQFDGPFPIDQVNARWVLPAEPDPTKGFRSGETPPPPTMPVALLEIYQDPNAGPAPDPDRPEPDYLGPPPEDQADDSNGNGAHMDPEDYQTPFSESALGKTCAALEAAGWKQVSEYSTKDFQHFYYQPPEGRQWKPTRRLYHLNDPYADERPAPPPKRRRRRQPKTAGDQK